MAGLTRESSIQELAVQAPNAVLWKALHSDSNRQILAERNMQSVGDLLTPEGEVALFRLIGTGQKSMRALYAFLTEHGLSPDWPGVDRNQQHDREEATRIRTDRGHGLNLERAIEEADKQYAARTGETVGDFSRKIKENTKAVEDGARLKGRRTL
jgi:hypothetical protein